MIKSALKCDSFDVASGIKILFFIVLVTIEPGRSLLTVRYHELFDCLRGGGNTKLDTELVVPSVLLNKKKQVFSSESKEQY